MLYLDDILYEIEESEIWSFNYNIMEGTIYYIIAIMLLTNNQQVAFKFPILGVISVNK